MQKIQRLIKNNSIFIWKSMFRRKKGIRRNGSHLSNSLNCIFIFKDYFSGALYFDSTSISIHKTNIQETGILYFKGRNLLRAEISIVSQFRHFTQKFTPVKFFKISHPRKKIPPIILALLSRYIYVHKYEKLVAHKSLCLQNDKRSSNSLFLSYFEVT